MLIFNEKEYYNHYFIQNDRILNITSEEKTLEELYKMLLQGENIASYITLSGVKGIVNNRSLFSQMQQHNQILCSVLNYSLNSFLDINKKMPDIHDFAPFDVDDAHEITNHIEEEVKVIQNTRPRIFFDYECKHFNLPLTTYTELQDWNDITKEDLIAEMGDALGIMPHFQKPEIPYEEQKHLSIIGQDLYYPSRVMEYCDYNALPTLEECRIYDSLPKNQKDFIRLPLDKVKFHPITLLHIIQNKYNGLINEQQISHRHAFFHSIYNSYHYSNNKKTETIDSLKELLLKNKQDEEQEFVRIYQDLVTKTDNLFKEKFHGRSPRVLNTLISGYTKAYLLITAENIVAEFNQQNISKVAKYNNETLFVLSGILNFGTLKESHLLVFGASILPENINSLKKNGFFNWYLKNANKISDTDLSIICKEAHKTSISLSASIPSTIQRVKNIRAIKDCDCYEKDYNYHFEDNTLAIRGRNIVCSDDKYNMYMLQADDLRNYTVGYDTHCCQHYGGAGSSCVAKLTIEPFAGVTVITKKSDDSVVAQAFVWTDEEKDTFVFDNMEFANDGKIKQYESVIAEYTKQLPYKNVHIGTGYLAGGMAGWGNKVNSIEMAKMPNTVELKKNYVYSDYHNNARVFKDNGRVLITPKHPVTTVITELNSNDILMLPENLWALRLKGKTKEEKIALLSMDFNTLSPQEQLDWIKDFPVLIDKIDYPTEECQRYICENAKDWIGNIHHPGPIIIEQQILNNPLKLEQILQENPDFTISITFCDELLAQHPTLLKKMFDLNIALSEDTLHNIIQQNPYNIRTIPNSYITPDILRFAIHQEPKIATILDVSEDLLLEAVRINPKIGALIDNPSITLQLAIVRADASAINNIKHPCREAVELAVHTNPLLIRNYQMECSDLISSCIQANPSVINIIKNPTSEHFSLLGNYMPTNPYVKQSYLVWQNREREIERV